jgi:Domain of unknown function (DUF4440)
MSGVASRARASILLFIFATLFSPAAVFGAEITDSEAARGAAAEVLQTEQRVGAAIVNGDAAFYDRVTADDFVMTHSDRWTTGGKPLLVDDKASFRKRIENRSYVSMDFDSVRIEMHGDVAITYGRYVSNMRGVAPDRAWFSVWYEKVYARRNGQWIYLSHRTVHGATYGLTREAVANQ